MGALFCSSKLACFSPLPSLCLTHSFATMAKSKNHTARNQTYKNHRNGIKKVKRTRTSSKKGQDARMVRNARFASRGNNAKRAGEEAWEKYVEELDAGREKRGA